LYCVYLFFGQIRLGHPHRIQIAEVVQSYFESVLVLHLWSGTKENEKQALISIH